MGAGVMLAASSSVIAVRTSRFTAELMLRNITPSAELFGLYILNCIIVLIILLVHYVSKCNKSVFVAVLGTLAAGPELTLVQAHNMSYNSEF